MATLYEKIKEYNFGFDIIDKTYDMSVYVEFDEFNAKYDDFDKVISRICRLLEVPDDLKLDEFVSVDITGLFKGNEDFTRYIRDNFDFNMDKNGDEMEYMVCAIFPRLVSGGVPDRIYTELSQEVFGIDIEIRCGFKNIAKKFDFKIKETQDSISLCAKDVDGKWIKWIEHNFKDNKTYITGNTDQCNLWFCYTRKDMTPDRILEFVANLNDTLRKANDYVTVKTLIDPEDWQEIAQVRDAYEDNRYQIYIREIAFEDNGNEYIFFTVMKEKYAFEGLFRIHDPANGPDMEIVNISDCCIKEDQDFMNAHWEEMEEKMKEYANERLNSLENSEENEDEVL